MNRNTSFAIAIIVNAGCSNGQNTTNVGETGTNVSNQSVSPEQHKANYAFHLARRFIKNNDDLKRFTDVASSITTIEKEKTYEVNFMFRPYSEEKESKEVIVRVNIESRQCTRIK